MLKKKKIIILIALITLILTLSQVSAETSPIQVRYVDQGNGQYTVQLDFTDIPKDKICILPEENSEYFWYTTEQFLAFFHSDQCLDRFKRRLKTFVEELTIK